VAAVAGLAYDPDVMRLCILVGGVKQDISIGNEHSTFVQRFVQGGAVGNVDARATAMPCRQRAQNGLLPAAFWFSQHPPKARFHKLGHGAPPTRRDLPETLHYRVVNVQRGFHRENHI